MCNPWYNLAYVPHVKNFVPTYSFMQNCCFKTHKRHKRTHIERLKQPGCIKEYGNVPQKIEMSSCGRWFLPVWCLSVRVHFSQLWKVIQSREKWQTKRSDLMSASWILNFQPERPLAAVWSLYGKQNEMLSNFALLWTLTHPKILDFICLWVCMENVQMFTNLNLREFNNWL